nr:MAG: VP1 [Canine parvovirus]
MAPTNKKPGGWVVPGYKYLGPFNPLDSGEPVNHADKAAQAHDFAYQKYINAGINPYFSYNKADADFIETLSHDSSVGGWLGRSAFRLKRILAPHLKETDNSKQSPGSAEPGPSGAKAPRLDKRADRAQKRKLYFARSNKQAKQQKMAEPEANQDVAEPGPSGSDRAGANGGGGGMGGGGHGVGMSTGGWQAGTVFGDDFIITTNTRQWFAPIYNGHLYKQIQPGVNSEAALNRKWSGISTPWGYFNFNEYDAHFSPQDWQRLTNEYKRWRPKFMKVKVYNLQIKQVVQLGSDTLYNNDLTAGVHIFCDGSHQFPYSQHPWDHGVMPELPNKIWKLSQYAYFQYHSDLTVPIVEGQLASPDVENQEKQLLKAAPLYMLETATHQVLRTGEDTSFNFSFDCGWVQNDRVYAIPQADFNPLVNTRRYFATRNNYTGTQGGFTYHRYSPYNKPSIWMPGPSLGYLGSTHTSSQPQYARGPITVMTQPPGTTGNETNVDEQSKTPLPTGDGMQQCGYDVAPVNCANSRLDVSTLAFDSSPESVESNIITTRDIDIDMARYASVMVQDGTINEIGSNPPVERNWYSTLRNVWMFPNQVWDTTPLSRDNPIWVKIPRTDKHTLLDSSDGTLPMAHPPGTIFVKVARIPIPTNEDSYLTLYVTGQVTCEIVWEAERFSTKNWRPEIKNDPSTFRDPTIYNFNQLGGYNTPETYNEGMPTKRGINRVL